MNGDRAKAAKHVKPGDTLEIRRLRYEHVVKVLGISGKRGNATAAQALYEETLSS